MNSHELRDLIVDLGIDVVVDAINGYKETQGWEDIVYPIDEFDSILSKYTPTQIATMIVYGEYSEVDDWFMISDNEEIITFTDSDLEESGDLLEAAEYMINTGDAFGIAEIEYEI